MLSEHPYLYCENDPVNRVDPSGRKWEVIKFAGGRIVVIVSLVTAVVTIIKLWELYTISKIYAECARQMRKMLEEWDPQHPERVRYNELEKLVKEAEQDATRATGNFAAEVAKELYKLFRIIKQG